MRARAPFSRLYVPVFLPLSFGVVRRTGRGTILTPELNSIQYSGRSTGWKCFLARRKPMPTTIEQASPWLQGRTFASWREEFDHRGYLFFVPGLSSPPGGGIPTTPPPSLCRDSPSPPPILA